MCDPFGDQESIVFREEALGEDKEEFTTILSRSLNRMRETSRKHPEITCTHVPDENRPVRIKDCDPRISCQHICPLIGRVPMQLAIAARRKPHVNASNVFGGRELTLRDLVSPPSLFDTLMDQIEGVPDGTYVAMVAGRRVVRVGVL